MKFKLTCALYFVNANSESLFRSFFLGGGGRVEKTIMKLYINLTVTLYMKIETLPLFYLQ